MKKYIFFALTFSGLVFAASSSNRTVVAQFIKNGTFTMTVPAATDTFVGKATTDTFTNKTFSATGTGNSLTNVANTNISASAAIDFSKLAALTSAHILVGNVSNVAADVAVTGDISLTNAGVTAYSGTVGVAKGGTGITSGTSGGVPYYSGAATIASSGALTQYSVMIGGGAGAAPGVLASVGSTGDVLTSQGAGVNPIFSTPASAPSASDDSINCSIAASVAASALTVALKDANGSDPAGGSPCKISFRNATATTGTYSQVSTTAAVSVVASNGSSLGCTVSVPCVVNIYAINNAGTVELGLIYGIRLDEGSIQSSTAEGGAGNADTIGTLYSTTARASKAVRFLARVTVTPAASFAWSNAPAEISNRPAMGQVPWRVDAKYVSTTTLSLGTVSVTSIQEMSDGVGTVTPYAGSAPVGAVCSTTNAATAPSSGASVCAAGNESLGINFVMPTPGLYMMCADFEWDSQSDSGGRANSYFEMVETPTNAQTITLAGHSKLGCDAGAITIATGTGARTGCGLHLCGLFDWSAIAAGTTKAIRVMYAQTVTGTVTTSTLYSDEAANTNSRNVHFYGYRIAE